MPLRWPDPYPAISLKAMLAAVFAKKSGREIALAAFREAFAGGKDLGHPDSIMPAGAAVGRSNPFRRRSSTPSTAGAHRLSRSAHHFGSK